jgi:hypothetical protein
MNIIKVVRRGAQLSRIAMCLLLLLLLPPPLVLVADRVLSRLIPFASMKFSVQ